MILRLFTCCFCLLLLAQGCGRQGREVRHYREIRFADPGAVPDMSAPTAPPMAGAGGMPDLPPEMQTPSLPLTWETPEGWTETRGSGMRVVTFAVEGQECTVLTFPGDVGGDEANIQRWIGQLGVNLPHDQVHAFVQRPVVLKTAGGFECRLFDFADLLPEGTKRSILAGIIPVGEHTAFVKLMGEAAVLSHQKEAFIELCESIGMER